MHGHADGSGNVIVVTDAGQQHLGCGGEMRSVLLGRLPFDRSLPGHGRLRSVVVPPFSTRGRVAAFFFHTLSPGRC